MADAPAETNGLPSIGEIVEKARRGIVDESLAYASLKDVVDSQERDLADGRQHAARHATAPPGRQLTSE